MQADSKDRSENHHVDDIRFVPRLIQICMEVAVRSTIYVRCELFSGYTSRSPYTMGNSQSSHTIPPPKPYLDEIVQEVDKCESPSVLHNVLPLSIDGSLTLKNVSTWESSATSNSKIQLARTILSQTDITSVLSSRSARIADQHIFNNTLDFKTGPVTNQKSSGRCWLFATTNVIRYGIMRKLKLKDFQLSQVRLIVITCSFDP